MEQLYTRKTFNFYPNLLRNSWILLLLLLLGLKNNAQKVAINDSIATITNNLNPAQTLQQLFIERIHFTKDKNRRINFGFTGCEYHYIILKLSAAHTFYNQYLSIDNASIDTISIYRLHENANDSLLYLGGQLVPFNQNSNYVWHTVPLEISDTPSYYCIAVKASQKNINLQYEINDRQTLLQIYEGDERIVFFYIGIAFMISAIIVVAWFLFKKPVFAAYLAYVICISVWIIAHYGRGKQQIPVF